MSDPAWSADFEPPPPPRTDRMRLEVLGPDVVDLDYDAIMGSRVRLRNELQWGTHRRWPPDDFTVNGNRDDLARHVGEYHRREAYAYTVLDPSGGSCIGCIYIEPHAGDAQLAFWVVDSELDGGLEAHLIATVLEWINAAWTFNRVVVSMRPVNERGIAVVEGVGLSRLEEPAHPDHVSYAWTRPA